MLSIMGKLCLKRPKNIIFKNELFSKNWLNKKIIEKKIIVFPIIKDENVIIYQWSFIEKSSIIQDIISGTNISLL